MDDELRVCLTVDSLLEEPRTAFSFVWLSFLSLANAFPESQCKAFDIGFTTASRSPMVSSRPPNRALFTLPMTTRISVAANP